MKGSNFFSPLLILWGLLTLDLAHAQDASAQGRVAWPSKPIRIVVPYATGGAPDVLGRVLGQKLTLVLGQSVVVENRPGAGGNLGAEVVAKSPADGYTLLMTTTATHSINQSLYRSMPFDSQKDFTPISLVAYTPLMLVVATDVPAKSLAELTSYGRANPGKLSYASAGSGTMQHIAAAMFNNLTGIDSVHVPYKGTGQVMPDLISGRVSMMFNSVAAVLSLVKEGKLRALGVSGAKRTAAAPEVPTLIEQGLVGFDASAWYAVFAPPGLPPDVLRRLNSEIIRIVDSPDMRERFAALGLDTATSSPEALDRIVRDDASKWAKVIKSNNIQAP